MVRMRWILFVIALVLGTALDLGTKEIAFKHLPDYGQTYAVWSWFSFTHAENPGAAFGMFKGQHDFFMVVTVVALVAVPYFVHSAPAKSRAIPIVLGLILAGVIGNFYDRIVFGVVRDFLDVHAPPGPIYNFLLKTIGRTVWPTFNVADVFITCGAVSMVIFFGRETAPAPATTTPAKDASGAALPGAEPPAKSADAAQPGTSADAPPAAAPDAPSAALSATRTGDAS